MIKNQSLKEKLNEMFWEDIGPKIRSDELPETVYHYTNLEGMMGIMTNKQLWMTKSDYLNDYTEIIYLSEIVEESLNLLNTKLIEKYGQEIKEDKYYKIFWEQFNKANEKSLDKTENLLELYVLSMSENQDSLTLWGNYAEGNGYSIAFEANTLINDIYDELNNFYIVYGRVVYSRKAQIKLLLDFLVNAFEFIYGLKPDINELESGLPALFKSTLVSYSIFFKNEAFEAEEEFRIVATIEDKAKVNFRSSNGVIIPYIYPEFEKIPVKEIIIGPKNNSDIAKGGVEFYLERLEYDLNTIKVIKSNVPLRY